MIQEIENRRSIRKYKPDKIERKLIEEIIYSASLAPSAKNKAAKMEVIDALRYDNKVIWLSRKKDVEKIIKAVCLT